MYREREVEEVSSVAKIVYGQRNSICGDACGMGMKNYKKMSEKQSVQPAEPKESRMHTNTRKQEINGRRSNCMDNVQERLGLTGTGQGGSPVDLHSPSAQPYLWELTPTQSLPQIDRHQSNSR